MCPISAPVSEKVNKGLSQKTPKNLINIAILGVESTGKTTLCQDLAQHYSTCWTSEFMRPYLQQKWDELGNTCEYIDLLPIAKGQIGLENQRAKQASHYLFCDTNLMQIMMYAYWYYAKCPKEIEIAALSHHYDLVLLTDIDVAWEADDLRDSPNDKEDIDAFFVKTLNQYNKPFRRIGGDRQTRVDTVAKWLKDCI